MDENRVEALLTAMRWRPGVDPGDIARRPPRLRGSGWDNEMWEIGALPDGTAVVLRLPHRELARPLLAREALALSALETTPITTPRLLAELDAEHPDGPALLVTWLNGELLLDRVAGTAPEDPAVRAHARSLARALSTLHRPVGPEHPRSAVRGVPLDEVETRMESDLCALPSTLRTTGGEPAREVLGEVFAAGLAAPAWDGPALFLHGDPHPGNLLVVPAPGTPSGEDLALLDWGDVTAGDPAGDLGDVLLLDPSGAALDAYPDSRDVGALHTRARAWAARYAASMLANAHRGQAALGEERLVRQLGACALRAAEGLATGR